MSIILDKPKLCVAFHCLCLLVFEISTICCLVFEFPKSALVSNLCIIYGQICDGRSHEQSLYISIFNSLKAPTSKHVPKLMDDVYVIQILFGFPMYIRLCKFPILMLLKFLLKLIHKKAKGPR